ncbi:hypothetical protein [Cobetia amphilecti]|uniref:hypothetical protein n=1 Tax=Cobetia amphilecti TaxID=1055104 RepID=UPI001C098C64|nr:hypothetical protein [Cobetia amphilecti]MBU3007816.1 hypothetical protein [Cobetia amphilecti]
MNTIFNSISKFSAELDSASIRPRELLLWMISNNLQFSWHPLGFAVCKLLTEGNISLRVHLWPNHTNYQQLPYFPIHDHLFELKSWVLSGAIENYEYNIDCDGDEYSIYDVSYNDKISTVKKSEHRCSLALVNRAVFFEGSSYNVSARTFHKSSSVYDGVSLTVCQTENMATTPPRVLGYKNGGAQYSYNRIIVEQSEIKRLIELI